MRIRIITLTIIALAISSCAQKQPIAVVTPLPQEMTATWCHGEL
jgi:PBP1b-binding outer membrane lipoprotein LpoB